MHIKSDGRRAPDLYAKPDQVGAADPLEHRQPDQRGLEQGADAEHRQRHDGDKTGGAAEDRVHRLVPPVQGAVGQCQQAVRAG